MRTRTRVAGICLLSVLHIDVCFAQMVHPPAWTDFNRVLGLDNGSSAWSVKVIQASNTTGVYWPGEHPDLVIQVSNNTGAAVNTIGALDVIPYGTRGKAGDLWLPQMIALRPKVTVKMNVQLPAYGYANIHISPSLPNEKGGYALMLDLGSLGRRLVTSVVRTFRPTLQRVQYPKQSLDDMGPEFLARVGVQAIRMGVDYVPTTFVDYRARMQALEEKLEEYHRNNITVLLMFGSGPNLMPLGTPRSFLDSSGVMLNTKQDYVWPPSLDEDFKSFVYTLCSRQGWPRGPVTAVSLWNEPWEGISISGWQSDMLRYRELYTKMADGVLQARRKGADVLVGGGDSGSNAWDKLFPDGDMSLLPVFDFCSIHYQGMEAPSIYPQWINRSSPKGRVRIWDTESWVGNTDDRIGLVVATNRAAGYDRSMGIYAGYMSTGGRGEETRCVQTIRTEEGPKEVPCVASAWSPAAAVGAVQHLIGERNFNRLLFKDGLPWVMVFDGLHNHADDGTIVVAGDIGEAFGKDNVLFRTVKLISGTGAASRTINPDGNLPPDSTDPAADKQNGGTLELNFNKAFAAYDFYGNAVAPANGKLIIPLNHSGYFLRTDGSRGSFQALTTALARAKIKGYEPVEIIAHDLTARIGSTPKTAIEINNIVNADVKGRLAITLGKLQVKYPGTVQLGPFQHNKIALEVTGGRAVESNTYPLKVVFTASTGEQVVHTEDLHVNLISKLSITVDGHLEDWKGALPQIVQGSAKASVTTTEAAWYPFKKFSTEAEGLASGYLAYDDQYFYFASKTADKTPHPGTYRFSNRPDDQFFYPDTAYKMNSMHTLLAQESVAPETADSAGLQFPGRPTERWMHYLESRPVTNSFALDLHLPDSVNTKLSLYLPNIESNRTLIVIVDPQTGKTLCSQETDNLQHGVYAVFAASGNVRVVLHSFDWWYTAKLAAVFFDAADGAAHGCSAEVAGVDAETRGNWSSKLGAKGYYIVGLPSQLPSGMSVKIVTEEVKDTLVWPHGVRHYTYRKDPVLPDNSGLGFSYDNVQIAFNAIPIEEDELLPNPPGTMPRFTGYKCTDYEYALNPVDSQYGGGTEIWRLLVPGMNRKHFFPRQPKSPQEGAVTTGKLVIRREQNTLITECAIPWQELPAVKRRLDSGKTVKFSFRVNDDGAPGSCLELARGRSVSKVNARAFHPDWKEHWANELEFAFEK